MAKLLKKGRWVMLVKLVQYFGKPVAVACDAKCDKAWGINNRPTHQLSDDLDDYESLADGELETAPDDPGTSEGGDCKPTHPSDRMNKWCIRECERSVKVDRDDGTVELPDFTRRIRNIPEGV